MAARRTGGRRSGALLGLLAAERLGKIALMEKSLRKVIEMRPGSAHAYNAS